MRSVVVLSGAGLSAASGIPTFRDANGLWEGHDVMEVATPEAWARDPVLVRRFYDERRVRCAEARPNAGHLALAALQRRLGARAVVLVTQNIDGLLSGAGAAEVIEMHGSLWRLRCEDVLAHPRIDVRGAQDPAARCAVCGAALRPDVVWFGEEPYAMQRILRTIATAGLFVAVGTSGVVYPAAGFAQIAHRQGVRTVEVNPAPSDAPWWTEVVAEGAETALPRLVEQWASEASR